MFDDGRFYLEIQSHGIEGEDAVNAGLIKMSKDLGIPLVATNDCHYLKRDHASAHDVLLCIQTGKNLSDTNRMRFDTDQVYLKSSEEMAELFWEVPAALAAFYPDLGVVRTGRFH